MNNIKIEVAKKAGFCFGVQRAVDLVKKNIAENENVYCWGDLVHNPVVMNDLRERGLILIDDLSKFPQGAFFVVRSHGMMLEDLEIVKKKTSKIINTTCPFVIKAQTVAQKLAEKGEQVLLFGDKEHVEVQGINSRTKNKALIVNGVDELILIKDKLKEKIAIVCQTTQKNSKLEEIVKKLEEWEIDFDLNNTICLDTTNKQKEVAECLKPDVLIVLGGLHSSNTTKLAEIGKSRGIRTYHIEKAGDISRDWFKGDEKVFITAGASTPPDEIGRVEEVIGSWSFGETEKEKSKL
jgi:4-hydroxy-3-methylbut-2-enyl diphosphate reductase